MLDRWLAAPLFAEVDALLALRLDLPEIAGFQLEQLALKPDLIQLAALIDPH